MLQILKLVIFGYSPHKQLKLTQIHQEPMPIFPDQRKISSRKKKKKKKDEGTAKSSLKVQDNPKKSPSSLSDSTDQKSNVTEQNLKLNIGRESILYSTQQASTHVDKAINQYPKHLQQEIVLNKSEEFQMLKVTCKYSKTIRNCSRSYNSINKFQT